MAKPRSLSGADREASRGSGNAENRGAAQVKRSFAGPPDDAAPARPRRSRFPAAAPARRARLLPCLALLLSPAAAAEAPEQASGKALPDEGTPIYGALSFTAESVSNLSGGRQTGTALESLLHVGGALNSDRIGLPPGGRLKLSAIRIDSQEPSLRYVGDDQVVSNIEAASGTRIYQLWYRQDFLSLGLRARAGLIDLNQYFDVVDDAGDLINSSFGISPGIAANAPVSIYAKPGYGAMLEWHHQKNVLRAAVFQGNPDRRRGLFGDGRTLIGEWQLAADRAQSVLGKLGIWQCRCRTADAADAMLHSWGIYGSLRYRLGRRAMGPPSLFPHLAVSPSRQSPSPFAVAAGLILPAPLPHREDDLFSIALTREDIRGRRAETAFEATYVLALSRHLSFQPDLQYVVNPSGSLPDAWVIIARLHIALESHFR